MPRCFVISPIGQEGSAIREHADNVFDYIIKPAMEECGIEAWRSDHLPEPGKISDQMFDAIMKDDLCIALLTGYNPNVFYELAVAQCAGRPVIIMAEKGHTLPFDIQDLRCVYYDLSPRPLMEKTHVKEIVAYVRKLEASGWQVSCPFRGFGPQAEETDPDKLVKYVPNSMDNRNTEQWGDLLRKTENEFEIMGVTPDEWRKVRAFRDLVIEKTAAGCKMRVLIMHEDNPALAQFINRRISEKSYEAMLVNNREIALFFERIAAQTKGLEVRRIKSGCPHFRITRTDKVAVLIPHLYSAKRDYSPVWEASADSSLYQMAKREFEALWEANDESVSEI